MSELPPIQRISNERDRGFSAAVVVPLGPVNLTGAQRLANAECHGKPGGGGHHDGKLGHDRPNLRVRPQQAAQPHRQQSLVLVVAQGQGDLKIFIGVHAAGVFEVAVTKGAGFTQQGNYFVLSRNQVHGKPFGGQGRGPCF